MNLLSRISFFILISLGVTACASRPAQAQLSCHDLNNMRHDVAQVADELDDAFDVSRSGDQELSDLIDAIYEVANDENNSVLFNAARRMERAWERQDKDAYVDALDQVTNEVNYTFYSEC